MNFYLFKNFIYHFFFFGRLIIIFFVLILEMSAAEFRNYLKTKGRNDPRIVPVDMKQKYELFQNM